MKINQIRKRSVKTISFTVIVLIIIILGCLYYARLFQKWPFMPSTTPQTPTNTNTVNYQAPTSSQLTAGSATKQQAVEDAIESSLNSDTPTDTIPISFTSVQPGSTVYIRTIIDRVTSAATCSLQMTGPEGKTYSSTVDTQAMASSSTCKGFNIPMSNLTSGSWKISVTVTDGLSSGTVVTEKNL